MPNHRSPPRDADDPRLPDRLTADLADLYRPPKPVPPALDEEILFAARRRFGDTRRARRWGVVGAIAAAVMLVFWLQDALQPPPTTEPQTSSPDAVARGQDIDRSGRVDILDAFALARHIETGASLLSDWDFNQDGRIDRLDVDAVAMTAVQLNGGAS